MKDRMKVTVQFGMDADVMEHLDAAAGCADCRTLGAPCLDHQAGAELARDCRVLYAAITTGVLN